MCVAVVQVVDVDYSAIPGAIALEPGDVIQLLEDDHQFSPLDLVGRQVVHFPGVPVRQMDYLVLQDEMPSALALLLKIPSMGLKSAMTNRHVIAKRRYQLDLNNNNIVDKTRG